MTASPEWMELAHAGAAHTRPCLYCCGTEAPEGAECKCVANCANRRCPKPVTRDDPVAYTEGFKVPAVPVFRAETDSDEPSEDKCVS